MAVSDVNFAFLKIRIPSEKSEYTACSIDTAEYLRRVAPNFKDIEEEQVLLCIDENKLNAEVCYEDGDNCDRYYPHVYGLKNNDVVIAVLPFIKDENGNYIKNRELAHIEDK